MSLGYTDTSTILPPGTLGCAAVEHFAVSESDSKLSVISYGERIRPGNYVRLSVNGHLMMTNTSMERRTNYGVLRNAKGDVLIAGLGIGMILPPILAKDEVRSVLVVEKYQDVIDLVAPHYQHPKLTVACADIFEWRPTKDQKFDTIYFDIWPDICCDNLQGINTLHRKARYWKRSKDSWMSSWQVDSLRYEQRRYGS
jgi:hypothetical protein